MRSLTLAIVVGVALINVAARGSDNPMPECAGRLHPIQVQIDEQTKQSERLKEQISEIRHEEEGILEKALREGAHAYKARLIKSWLMIEKAYDQLQPPLKDIDAALQNVAVWATENQMQECIKLVGDEQQVVQKNEQQTGEMMDKMRDNFIQRFEKLKQNETEPPQQPQHEARWVLWMHSSAIDLSYHAGPKESWVTVAALGSKAECLEGLQKKLREFEKDGFKWQTGYTTAFKEGKDRVLYTVQCVCLTDSEDPRQKKNEAR
jgi:hypothetical protein